MRAIRIGETGEFPYGKLNSDDEGEIKMAVAGDRETETVILDFGHPVAWIGMRPEQAEALAHTLLRKAQEARR